VTAVPRGDKVSLEVRDEGAGIDPEAAEHLFERFFRIDDSKGTPRGTGLGLAIAKEIVEAHDSTIDVASHPGEGAAFTFDLPLVDQSKEERRGT
jgi:signal transduction histidine kinase